MTTKEIADLSTWTAKSICDTIKESGRKIDAAGQDIIREYIQTCLHDWQVNGNASLENCAQMATEIFMRRKSETKTELETFNSLLIFGANFPEFVKENQRERDAEATQLANEIPPVKI